MSVDTLSRGKYEVLPVDGTAASGKGTDAGRLSKELDYPHIDSGSGFRAVTWALQAGWIKDEDLDDVDSLRKIGLEYREPDGALYIRDLKVGDEIRTSMVSSEVANVAPRAGVLDYINELVQQFASRNSLVVEGRQMTSHTFKEAPVKYYLDADIQVRTARRVKDLTERFGVEPSLESIMANLEDRDFKDKNRAVQPLRLTKDTMYLDTSNRTVEECIDLMLDYRHKVHTAIERGEFDLATWDSRVLSRV